MEISKEENLKALKINDLEFKKFSLENKVRNLEGNLSENKFEKLNMKKEIEEINKQLYEEKNKKKSLELKLNEYKQEIEINNFYKTFESEIMQEKALNFLKNIEKDIKTTIEKKFGSYFTG